MKQNILNRVIQQTAKESKVFHPRLLLARLLLAPLPPLVGGSVRARLLRMIGFSIGPRTYFFDMPTITGAADIYHKLSVGSDCTFAMQLYLDLADTITIQDGVSIGPQSTLITGTHAIGKPGHRMGRLVAMPICIGAGVWLGARCTILPGVTIGEGSVIGAGSVVSEDIPPNTYAAGFPAAVKKELRG